MSFANFLMKWWGEKAKREGGNGGVFEQGLMKDRCKDGLTVETTAWETDV